MDHPHGVVINSKVIIGSNFTIRSGAIIVQDVLENAVMVCDAAHILKSRIVNR